MTAEAQKADPASTFSLYKRALAVRKGLESLKGYDANGLMPPLNVTAKDHGGGGKTVPSLFPLNIQRIAEDAVPPAAMVGGQRTDSLSSPLGK